MAYRIFGPGLIVHDFTHWSKRHLAPPASPLGDDNCQRHQRAIGGRVAALYPPHRGCLLACLVSAELVPCRSPFRLVRPWQAER